MPDPFLNQGALKAPGAPPSYANDPYTSPHYPPPTRYGNASGTAHLSDSELEEFITKPPPYSYNNGGRATINAARNSEIERRRKNRIIWMWVSVLLLTLSLALVIVKVVIWNDRSN